MEHIEYRFILKTEEERTEEEKEAYRLFFERMDELEDEYEDFCYFQGYILQNDYDSISFEVDDESLIQEIQQHFTELQVDWDSIHCYEEEGENTICIKSRNNILYKKEVHPSCKKSYVLVEELTKIVKEAENDKDIAEKLKSILQIDDTFESIPPIDNEFFIYGRL